MAGYLLFKRFAPALSLIALLMIAIIPLSYAQSSVYWVVSINPSSQTVSQGQSAYIFSVLSSSGPHPYGTSLPSINGYQWYAVTPGTSSTSASQGSALCGASGTSNECVFSTSPSTAMGTYEFVLWVNESGGIYNFSNTASVTVGPASTSTTSSTTTTTSSTSISTTTSSASTTVVPSGYTELSVNQTITNGSISVKFINLANGQALFSVYNSSSVISEAQLTSGTSATFQSGSFVATLYLNATNQGIYAYQKYAWVRLSGRYITSSTTTSSSTSTSTVPSSSSSYTLYISPSNCTSTSLGSGTGTYPPGTKITIFAFSVCRGQKFSSWSGSGSGSYSGSGSVYNAPGSYSGPAGSNTFGPLVSANITFNGNIYETATYSGVVTTSTTSTITIPPSNRTNSSTVHTTSTQTTTSTTIRNTTTSSTTSTTQSTTPTTSVTTTTAPITVNTTIPSTTINATIAVNASVPLSRPVVSTNVFSNFFNRVGSWFRGLFARR